MDSEALEDNNKYLVLYAKFIDDKHEGIYLDNIYFGGISTGRTIATEIAKSCVSEIRGGSVFPHISILNASYNELLSNAWDKFRNMERSMIDSEDQMAINTEMAERRKNK